MNSKTLIGGVIGGVLLFVTGGLVYMVLFKDFFMLTLHFDPPNFVYIAAGEIVFGIVLSYIIGGTNTVGLAASAQCGAIVGFLVSLGFGLLMQGAMDLGADLTYWLAESFAWAFRFAVAGAGIGWWNGRGAAE